MELYARACVPRDMHLHRPVLANANIVCACARPGADFCSCTIAGQGASPLVPHCEEKRTRGQLGGADQTRATTDFAN